MCIGRGSVLLWFSTSLFFQPWHGLFEYAMYSGFIGIDLSFLLFFWYFMAI